MNWVKGFALATCLATPLSVIVATSSMADPTPAAKTEMSAADKEAKAVECSKQADAKKLHGEARKKFRAACKRGK